MIGVICWLNGIGHVISVGIFVIENKSIGQMKVNFLLDGCVWVWQHKNTAFHDGDVMGTTAFGCGSVTVCEWFSLTCKLDLHVLQRNLNELFTVTTFLAHKLYSIFIIIHWLTGRSLWITTPDRTELAL